MKHKLLSIGIIGILLFTGVGCSNPTIKPTTKTAEDLANEAKPKEHTELITAKDFNTDTISDEVNKVINEKFPGDWSVDGTILKKGKHIENDNFGIVDELAKSFPGSMASLYVGETRVSNTVKNKSGRYLNYKTPSEVAETIKTGKPIFDDAKLNDTNYHKVYLPIKVKDKIVGVIGMSFKIGKK